MLNKEKKFKSFFYFLITLILTLGLSISLQSLLAAWTGPTASPPTCPSGSPGCDAPINQGSTNQTKTGYLGIGNNPSPPNRQLHIYDTVTNAEIDLQSVAGAGNHWAIYNDNSTGQNQLRFWQGNDRLVINANGNVGIGTTNPSTSLDIAAGTLHGIALGTGDYPSWMGDSGMYLAGQIYALGGYIVGSGQTINWGDSTVGIKGDSASDYISFKTNNSEKFRVNSAGNVGIGTAAPTEKLYVSGNIYATGNITCGGSCGGGGISGWTDGGTIVRLTTASDKVGIGTASPVGKLHVSGGDIRLDNNYAIKWGGGSTGISGANPGDPGGGTVALSFITNGIARVGITTSGNVGIGLINPSSYQLYVAGTAYSTGGWQSSDIRFKENITSIDSPLNKILNIEGVIFNWKTGEYKDKGFPEGRHFGVTAQQIEEVLPEVVSTGGPDGEKAVSYTEIIPVLIEAIKEQQKEIESLRAEIKELKNLINK